MFFVFPLRFLTHMEANFLFFQKTNWLSQQCLLISFSLLTSRGCTYYHILSSYIYESIAGFCCFTLLYILSAVSLLVYFSKYFKVKTSLCYVKCIALNQKFRASFSNWQFLNSIYIANFNTIIDEPCILVDTYLEPKINLKLILVIFPLLLFFFPLLNLV